VTVAAAGGHPLPGGPPVAARSLRRGLYVPFVMTGWLLLAAGSALTFARPAPGPPVRWPGADHRATEGLRPVARESSGSGDRLGPGVRGIPPERAGGDPAAPQPPSEADAGLLSRALKV